MLEGSNALQPKRTSALNIHLHTKNIWTAEGNRRSYKLGMEEPKINDFYNLRGR